MTNIHELPPKLDDSIKQVQLFITHPGGLRNPQLSGRHEPGNRAKWLLNTHVTHKAYYEWWLTLGLKPIEETQLDFTVYTPYQEINTQGGIVDAYWGATQDEQTSATAAESLAKGGFELLKVIVSRQDDPIIFERKPFDMTKPEAHSGFRGLINGHEGLYPPLNLIIYAVKQMELGLASGDYTLQQALGCLAAAVGVAQPHLYLSTYDTLTQRSADQLIKIEQEIIEGNRIDEGIDKRSLLRVQRHWLYDEVMNFAAQTVHASGRVAPTENPQFGKSTLMGNVVDYLLAQKATIARLESARS